MSGQSKIRPVKAAGAEVRVQQRHQKLHAAVAKKNHFEVKMCKTPHAWTTFRSCDVEKLHPAVARNTFGSEDVQNTDHFLKLRCRKITRRCGEKLIMKSKC